MEPTREWHAGAGGSHEKYMKHSHLLLLAGLLFQPTRQQPHRTAPHRTWLHHPTSSHPPPHTSLPAHIRTVRPRPPH